MTPGVDLGIESRYLLAVIIPRTLNPSTPYLLLSVLLCFSSSHLTFHLSFFRCTPDQT
ncbi:hypothetical protein BJY04DRAFT_127940 [Aspergillus karnatakaensis]|uniref:uncharacterized protein n=1 Tax=Aspergillus karnatakaensis TaxID=1810916 RepID=UPI003CCE112B